MSAQNLDEIAKWTQYVRVRKTLENHQKFRLIPTRKLIEECETLIDWAKKHGYKSIIEGLLPYYNKIYQKQIAANRIKQAFKKFKKQRDFRPYFLMGKEGELWRDPNTFNTRALLSASGLDKIIGLSKRNLEEIQNEIIKLGDNLTEKECQFAEEFQKCKLILSHYTVDIGAEAISKTGRIYSKRELVSLGKLKVNNTPKYDEELLGNHGFVFFKLEVGNHDAVSTRFGNVGYIFEAHQTPLLECGWISLYDQISPTVNEIRSDEKIHPLKNEVIKNKILRKYVAADNTVDNKNMMYDNKTGLSEKVFYNPATKDIPGMYKNYPETGVNNMHNQLEEVFYGPDILDGIIYSILFELRKIGMDTNYYKKAISDLTPEGFKTLLAQLFRIEAKIPRVLFIGDNPPGIIDGYRVIKVPKGGDCMFNAITKLLNNGTQVQQLRNSITNHMFNYFDNFKEFNITKDRINQVNKPGYLGGYAELYAIACYLRKKIFIHQFKAQPIIIQGEGKHMPMGTVDLHLHYLDNHYNALTKA